MDVLVELAAPKAARNPASGDPAPAVSSHRDAGLDQIGYTFFMLNPHTYTFFLPQQ